MLSRMAIFESPIGGAMVGRLAEVVVGSGLSLRPQPIWDIIDPTGAITPEARAAWTRNVEQRYRLWSRSYAPEYNTRRNLPQISRAVFDYLLQDGEYFAMLRYANTARANPLTIQLIPPENIQGGAPTAPGNEVVNGIEYDGYGQAIAYFVLDDKTGITTRVPRFGSKSGRVMMIHNFLSTNEKQRRGVPYLASCLQNLVKLGHYEDLEIQAAVVNALFAAWVKPPTSEDGEPIFSGGTKRKAQGDQAETVTDSTDADEYVSRANRLDYERGGIILDALPAGHELQSFDTKRPNSGFDNFYHAITRNLAASKGQPVSAVELNFNQSYSGARGELLMFWMAVERYRQNHGYDFEDDIYQMWFLGEVDRGRIDAPLVYHGQDYLLAYTSALWIGNRLPNMDPKNLVEANILEHEKGYKTGDMITAETNGSDYNDNLEKIKGEFDKLAEVKTPANIKAATPAAAPAKTAPAPGSAPAEPDEDDTSGDNTDNQGGQ
jgi:lambda family phage portal protein